ncbi:metalloenzyme [Zopfochytrium polystomum]|nr:metalloenzyme [Zopfochytrium polystomum]
MTEVQQKACLIVIDGWGIAPDTPEAAKGDAIRQAATPVMSKLAAEYPYTPLAAHGLAVGLPDGLMGNSEVGHLNIGAGRVVYQDIVRIDLSLKNDTLKDQPNFAAALARASNPTGSRRIHFLGLISDGGVHSHQNHLHAMLKAAKDAGVPEAFIHFVADGRDTSPRSAHGYLKTLQQYTQETLGGYGTLATVVGRYYAMDRDKRWERVKIAVDALLQGPAAPVLNATVAPDYDAFAAAVEASYARDETDEFLKPIVASDARGTLRDGDTVVCFNYRSDRMREITAALGISPAPYPVGEHLPKDLEITTMTQYKADYPFKVIFPPQTMDNVLAEWLAAKSVPQCHVAETEKYAHVTFFFNGGTEAQYALEEREMIASPKVATYDLKPSMSAVEVGEKVAERIATNKFPFVMCNFAPPDMVGHTGILDAAKLGVEATDTAIGIIYRACVENGYVLFVTADHGNAEKMLAADGTPHTAHTTSPVPFIMTSKKYAFKEGADGVLADVAPTVLDVMGLQKPDAMTGVSLIKH